MLELLFSRWKYLYVLYLTPYRVLSGNLTNSCACFLSLRLMLKWPQFNRNSVSQKAGNTFCNRQHLHSQSKIVLLLAVVKGTWKESCKQNHDLEKLLISYYQSRNAKKDLICFCFILLFLFHDLSSELEMFLKRSIVWWELIREIPIIVNQLLGLIYATKQQPGT